MVARRLASLSLVLCLFLVVSGCVKLKWKITVNHDGSGKFELVGNIDNMASVMGRAPSEAELMDELTPERLKDKTEGIVAFGKVEKFSEGYTEFIKITGYFEDINEVRFWMDDARTAGPISFSFVETGDGLWEISLTDKVSQEVLKLNDHAGPDGAIVVNKATREAVLFGSPGYATNYTFRLPGRVKKAERMGHEGNWAGMRLTIDKILKMAEETPNFLRDGIQAKAQAEATAELTGDLTEFEKELERAKARWADIQAGIEVEPEGKRVKERERERRERER